MSYWFPSSPSSSSSSPSSTSSTSSTSSSTDARALVKQPPSRLTCSICQEVFVHPVHGLPCCHCFCKKCILEWNKTSSTCPICRETMYEDDGVCILRKAIMVTEFLEELEVMCRYGVKCTVACQNFGVLGNEFEALPDGCTVKMPIKNIKSHEEKCPYGKSRRNDYQQLQEENAQLREKVVSLKRKIGSMYEEVERLSQELQDNRDLYEMAKVSPFYSYNYQIEDALPFAKMLAYRLFDGSDLDRNRCYTALQRLATEWARRKYEFFFATRESMHFLFYTATMCNFWTPKQISKLTEWRDDFDPAQY